MTDAFSKTIPGPWHRFGTVLSFRCRRVLDSASWFHRYDGELILTDAKEEVQIRLTLENISGKWQLQVGQVLSGFQVLDTQGDGYQKDVRYRIRDFEDGGVDLYCQNIRVEVLEGPDRYQEDCP